MAYRAHEVKNLQSVRPACSTLNSAIIDEETAVLWYRKAIRTFVVKSNKNKRHYLLWPLATAYTSTLPTDG